MAALGVLVLGLTVFFSLRYRRRAGEDGPTPRIEAPLWLELGLATGLLALFVGYWFVGFKQYVRFTEAPPDALEVYVTAKQWMWKFAYPDGRASVDALYVPAGRPVRLLLTSRDVIHSFYVPASG